MKSRGYSMVELSVGLALAIPVLFGILSITLSIGKAAERERTTTSAKGQLQVTFDRIEDLLTSASWSSLRVPTDLPAAGEPEWTYPRGPTLTHAVRFQSVVADLPQEDLGETLTLRFVRDEHEKLDGQDNDGDGLIDEGRILFEIGPDSARAVALAQEVEACSFLVADGVVTVSIKIGVVRRGAIKRAGQRRTIWLRNP